MRVAHGAPAQRAVPHPRSPARRIGAVAGLCGALLLAGVLTPALADDGRPLLAPIGAAKPPKQRGGAVVAVPKATTTSTTSTVALAVPGANRNDALCRNRLKLTAQLEREKARALTLLARATDRLDRARLSSRPAVVAAFQKEVDSNQARVDEIDEQLDQLRVRCA